MKKIFTLFVLIGILCCKSNVVQISSNTNWESSPNSESSMIRVKNQLSSQEIESIYIQHLGSWGIQIDSNEDGTISTAPFRESGKDMVINLSIKDNQIIISGVIDKIDLNPSLPNWVKIKKGTSSWGTSQWERINALSFLIRPGQISFK